MVMVMMVIHVTVIERVIITAKSQNHRYYHVEIVTRQVAIWQIIRSQSEVVHSNAYVR